EVEKVSIHRPTTAAEESHALHRQLRSRVRRRPMISAVEGFGYIEVPHTRVSIGTRSSAPSFGCVKRNSGTTSIASHGRGESHIGKSKPRAHIKNVCPSLALITRDSDCGVRAVLREEAINFSGAINANRRIIRGTGNRVC